MNRGSKVIIQIHCENFLLQQRILLSMENNTTTLPEHNFNPTQKKKTFYPIITWHLIILTCEDQPEWADSADTMVS